MASKIADFISKADAKTRFLMVAAVVGVLGGIIYFVANMGSAPQKGQASVAGAPSLQSVPGSQLSPEYYRALIQSNAQSAKQAQISGGSAVPTLVNAPAQPSVTFTQPSCTIVCPGGDNVDVNDDLNSLVKAGKLSQEDATSLSNLAKANVSVGEYADALNELVRTGKLTPEQARKLLEDYKKQHENSLLSQSGRGMDALIKAGKLPLSVATSLMDLQKQNLTPAQYADELNRLVREGKISPEVAAQLLAQYTQQRNQEAAKESAGALKQMAKAGQISPDVAGTLTKLQEGNASVGDYSAAINRMVADGKMTPDTAAKLLAQYQAQRAGQGSNTLSNLVGDADSALVDDVQDTAASGLLSSADAANLLSLQKKGASPAEYCDALNKALAAKKISAETKAQLCAKYSKLHALKEEAARLANLQANNATAVSYADELKQAVTNGTLSPEMAAKLSQEYKAATATVYIPAAGQPGDQKVLPGGENLAGLQQRLQEQNAQSNVGPTNALANNDEAEFLAAQAKAEAMAAQQRQQRIQDLMTAMSGQSQSLIAAWQVPVMQHKAGVPDDSKKSDLGSLGSNIVGGANGKPSAADAAALAEPPLIKAGTILFAILDTAVNSDYPNTPVMATIVTGPFKGAKLLGKLNLEKDQDRVSLSFNLMDKDAWINTKTVDAFAIDPETARTVMASNVDHHYMLRYGTLFASSFVTGYANGIMRAGTATTGIFGTSTTNPELSPTQKIAVGLGQVGTTFGTALQSYVNTPATVKVNAGVALGILFMSDVTEQEAPAPAGGPATASTTTTTVSATNSSGTKGVK